MREPMEANEKNVSGRKETGVTWEVAKVPLLQVAAAAAKSLQSCPTLCDPIDSSQPGYPVSGILQARTVE